MEQVRKSFGDRSSIVVVDDFSSNAGTWYETERAFGFKIPYYSIFTSDWSTLPSERSGMQIKATSHEDNPATSSNAKLSYTAGETKRAIGVTKTRVMEHAIPLWAHDDFSKEDSTKMDKLRKEMRSIGEEIAKTV